MNAKTLIKKLESNDVKIWIEDYKVKWNAPKGVITDTVLVQMKEKKTELVMILRDKQRIEKQGIKGKNPKKPEKCEVQGCTNKIMDDPVAQAQRIIQEALDENNKKTKDIMSVRLRPMSANLFMKLCVKCLILWPGAMPHYLS